MYQQVPADSTNLVAVGTATSDATIADTKGGKAYARFQVKVEGKQEVIWLSVIAFDAGPVECARKVRQGARVEVGGRLQIRVWSGTDGKERTSVGIVAATLTVLTQPPQADSDPFDDMPF